MRPDSSGVGLLLTYDHERTHVEPAGTIVDVTGPEGVLRYVDIGSVRARAIIPAKVTGIVDGRRGGEDRGRRRLLRGCRRGTPVVRHDHRVAGGVGQQRD